MNTVSEITDKYREYKPDEKKKGNALDKDAFLKLMITQLKSQDPLNPMEDREFIAQMAQFSSLEQMQNLNNTLKTTQLSLIEHITQMNSNMSKSQKNILTELEKINSSINKYLEQSGGNQAVYTAGGEGQEG